jgi:hypothetical protein
MTAVLDEAIELVLSSIEWSIVKTAAPASPRVSPNALSRNDWTPRERIEWTVSALIDGEDVLDVLLAEDAGSVFRTKTEAAAEIERLRSRLVECYGPRSYWRDDLPHDDELASLVGRFVR